MRARLALPLAFLGLAAAAEGGDVAIVVHRNHPQEALSMTELARVFRLDQQHWKNGERIELVLQLSGSAKEAVILERIYHMKADELKPFWLGRSSGGS